MSEQVDFTVDQAVRVQRSLRAALGLEEEAFPLPAFVGMISDEIQQMRAAGRSDQEVLDIIKDATGKDVLASDLARFYAPPELRLR